MPKMMRAIPWTILWAIIMMHTAHANDEQNQQLYITADSLTHDEKEKLFYAIGNVEMVYGDYVLTADRVLFSEDEERARVEGNVRLLTPNDTIIYGRHAVLDDHLENGIISQLRMILKDGRFAARSAIRINGNENHLSQAVYSSCRPCDESSVLPWKIKADTIIHDEQAQDMIYHHAVLEIYDVPVFYLPYYITPDPTVKRRSGLLRPLLDYSSLLGSVVAVPIYVAYSPYGDVTITPGYVSREGALFMASGRHNFTHSTVQFASSLSYDDRDGDVAGQWLGHVNSKAQFGGSHGWHMGWDGQWISQRTYLKRYSLITDDRDRQDVHSQAFINYDDSHIHTRLNASYFQDLRPVHSRTNPSVLPHFRVTALSPYNDDDQRWQGALDVRNLLYGGESLSQRIIGTMDWEAVMFWQGLRVTTQLETRADFYHYEHHPQISPSDRSVRFIPRASLTARYPLYEDGGIDWFVLEPRLLFTLAPNNVRNNIVTPRDNGLFSFDSSRLFRIHRLAGDDIVEGGGRVDYGFDAHFGRDDGESLFFRLGQSMRVHKDDTLPHPLGNRRTDIAGGITWRWRKEQGIHYQFNIKDIARGGHAFPYQSLSTFWREDDFSFVTQYQYTEQQRAHELNGHLSLALSEDWQWGGHGRYNVAKGQSVRYGAFVRYQRDCINVAVAFEREFVRDGDAASHDTVSVKINFIGLGGDEF